MLLVSFLPCCIQQKAVLDCIRNAGWIPGKRSGHFHPSLSFPSSWLLWVLFFTACYNQTLGKRCRGMNFLSMSEHRSGLLHKVKVLSVFCCFQDVKEGSILSPHITKREALLRQSGRNGQKNMQSLWSSGVCFCDMYLAAADFSSTVYEYHEQICV